MKSGSSFGRFTGRRTEASPTVEDWPPLHDDVKELQNIEAWERGAVALDVAIDKYNVPKIFEIHGLGAGVQGFQELEEEDLLSDLANIDENQLDFWIDKTQVGEERQKRIEELRRIKGIAKAWSRKEWEYTNPEWFAGERGITRDKRKQAPFIRDENRPETINNGNFEPLFANHDRIVIKPPDESQGRGIRVFNAGEIAEAREYGDRLKAQYGGFQAQGFIESRGAELAPPDLRGHAQSLRVIFPFKMNEKGEPEIEIPGFGYHRVARYSGQEAEEGTRLRGKRVNARDASVVNLSRDAAAIPMKDTEYAIVLPAALATIKRLTEHAKTQPDHVDKMRKILFDKARALQQELNEKYKLQIEYLQNEFISPYDKNYVAEVRKAFDDTKQYIFFLRFVERELAAVPKKLWETAIMERNSYCRLELLPGARQAIIDLRGRKSGSRNLTFNLKNADDTVASGSLKKLLEKFVEDNRGALAKFLRPL